MPLITAYCKLQTVYYQINHSFSLVIQSQQSIHSIMALMVVVCYFSGKVTVLYRDQCIWNGEPFLSLSLYSCTRSQSWRCVCADVKPMTSFRIINHALSSEFKFQCNMVFYYYSLHYHFNRVENAEKLVRTVILRWSWWLKDLSVILNTAYR